MEKLGAYDVAVVGGGVVGASAAFFAARQGARVVLLEKGEPGQEASGRNAGGIRQQGRHTVEVPLAIRSIRLWEWFRDERGGRFEYVQNGNLYLALNPKEEQVLKEAKIRQQAAGLPVQFLTGPEVRDMAPAVSDRVRAANYCPTDGHANPILATRFVLRQAVQAGTTLLTHTRVTGIEMQSGRPAAILTDRGRVECRAVIIASGGWATEVAQSLGVNLPLLPRRTQICVTTPLPPLLSQFISGNTVYVRQALSGNMILGGGGPWEPLGYDHTTTSSSLRRFAARAMDLVPALRKTSILRTWAGTLSISPDGAPLIGPAPGVEGIYMAVGFTGHGFAMGPGAGEVTARMALGLEPGVEIGGLSPARFTEGYDFASRYRVVAEPAP